MLKCNPLSRLKSWRRSAAEKARDMAASLIEREIAIHQDALYLATMDRAPLQIIEEIRDDITKLKFWLNEARNNGGAAHV
jgi:hypothetical protein